MDSPDDARTNPTVSDGDEIAEPGSSGSFLGPATWPRMFVFAVAFAFLGAAIGWAVGSREKDPFNKVDVGFMQDMTAHHDQAVQMSKMLLFKEGIDRDLRTFAEEFLGDQRFEQGIFNAFLTRFGRPVANPDGTAMGWMGAAVPVEKMSGMATAAQLNQLRDAQGAEAESLFIALMSEHHIGGLHMSYYETLHGKDKTVRNLAAAMLKTQRGEVFDLARARVRLRLPIPKGFTDPTKDPRLDPAATSHD